MVNQHIGQHQEEFQEEETIEFNRLDWDNALISPVTEEEVKARITNLKKKKAPGASKINAQLLQHATPNIIQQITNIYNACLSSGYFPKAFKEAIMVLIPKGERDTTNPSNYRPISLLENIGKILERIVNERLQGHLEENQLLNERQFGFRKRRGCQEAIALAAEFISQMQASRKIINVVTRDVSKAVDKVWHEGLRYKIHTSFHY